MRAMGILFAVLLGACSGPPQGPDPAAVEENNGGVGLMGQFNYEAAHQVFARLAERHPDWQAVRVNLAIATLNRQQEDDDRRALELAEAVLEQDPGNLRAHYVAGLMALYLGQADAALSHFRTVAEADPSDAYAAYYVGQLLAQRSEYEQALEWYRRAMGLDPYLRSAYYGAFQALRQLKRVDEARRVIADYQRLAANPRAHLAEFKYTRMGPKAEALAMGVATPQPPKRPPGPVFADPRPLQIRGPVPTWKTRPGPISLTAVDLNDDGRPELVFAADVVSGPRPNLVLEAAEGGGYRVLDGHPLAGVARVNAALWGDFDNDGLVDVYLARHGPNQLWRQSAPGTWEDITATSKTAGGELDTVDGAVFDADHDGDLDIFLVNADGPNELLNNNLDGSFRPLAASRGLAGDGGPSRQVLPVDLDGDRDLDIVVINARPPHEVYLNDRLWDYRPAPGFKAFRSSPALAVVAGDTDADGQGELYSLGEDATLRQWRSDGQGERHPRELGRIEPPTPPWGQLAIADVDGDGRAEIIAASARGWSAFTDGGEVLFRAEAGEPPLIGTLALLQVPAKGPSLLAWGETSGPLAWAPGSGRFPFLALAFSGKEDKANSMRSNASGIGTRVAVRVDSRWSMGYALRESSGPGQGLQPLAIGLGGAPRADFIAIDWSDGVFQSELALQAGQIHRITETQRQLSSCPVLFAWDGERYAFVSDLLGVGGIGYAVGPGEYATPRPWENLLLPQGMLRPRSGAYVIKIGEPMEETAYLDAARLVAYDLPPGWQMVLDERMGINGPPPTGRPRFYRHEVLPRRAVNERGEDITAAVLEADGGAAPVGDLDGRFIGRLRGEHVLELAFDTPLDQTPGDPLLVIDGWVEYPYSQTMFAAWQAGAGYQAPSLEARDEAGHWHTLWQEFGYPAGMPRRMSVPLGELPEGTDALRLRTNMEIYFDRIAVAYAQPEPALRRVVLPLQRARLTKPGFPRRITHAQRRPDYDYAQRSPFWDTRYMAGLYTRLGPVEELVVTHDDALTVIGAGEEVELAFSAELTPPERGWTRRFVLETHGWAKDMDLYTRDGETVGPLPRSDRPPQQAAQLNARYNTRYQAGH
jgi:Tfp pilus assembly protein PilF